MNRKELYAKVKELNLQDIIKDKCGDNYTRVSSSELAHIISIYSADNKKNNPVKEVSVVPEKEVSSAPTDKFTKLIEVLVAKHILLKSELDYINS